MSPQHYAVWAAVFKPVFKSLVVWGLIFLYSCCQISGDRQVPIHWLFGLDAVNLSPPPHSQPFSALCKTLYWASCHKNTLLFNRLWESSAMKVYFIQPWSRCYHLLWKGIRKLQFHCSVWKEECHRKICHRKSQVLCSYLFFWGISCDRLYSEIYF